MESMPRLQKGQNPRKVLSNHRERGPAKHYYELSDIADAAGVTLGAVEYAIICGKLKPADIANVFTWISQQIDSRSAPISKPIKPTTEVLPPTSS